MASGLAEFDIVRVQTVETCVLTQTRQHGVTLSFHLDTQHHDDVDIFNGFLHVSVHLDIAKTFLCQGVTWSQARTVRTLAPIFDRQ